MPIPTKEKWREISNTFMEKTHFPNCLGAIDGKHIRMVMPPASGSRYFNYKKNFSVVLMAVADDYNLIFIDVGSYGSAPDSSVFQHSQFYKKRTQGQLDIPEPCPLPGTSDSDLPMVFVADEAFAISDNLMRPYSSRSLDEKRSNFNYRLSKARRMVECTFGILANKWRVLHTAISLNVNNAVEVIKAACILHNFCIGDGGGAVEYDRTCDVDVCGEGDGGGAVEYDRTCDVDVCGEGDGRGTVEYDRTCDVDVCGEGDGGGAVEYDRTCDVDVCGEGDGRGAVEYDRTCDVDVCGEGDGRGAVEYDRTCDVDVCGEGDGRGTVEYDRTCDVDVCGEGDRGGAVV
ncbi:LOW QUALITY PROTEIN: uncharacterized protein ACMZJ9_007653 [Mantella aurantiaca]